MLLATTLLPLFAFLPAKARDDWKNLLSAAWHFNTGQYSLADATTDLRGRAKDFGGKLQLSGNHPAFREIYEILPPKTRIWSFSNIAYCMLPACNIGRQSADITATRWYELPAASIEQGRALLQSEGKNYFFYSTIIPDNHYADTKDVLAALYPGLHPEHINDTFGIAWTNGTDYLLTWKSPATHPLDNNFLTSWSRYHRESVALREHYFSTVALAPYIAEAVKNHQLKHPLRIE